MVWAMHFYFDPKVIGSFAKNFATSFALSLTECLVGFEPGTFQFWSQSLNPLDHSLPVAFQYQSVLWQVLSKTSQLRGIYNYFEVNILLL